MNGWTLTGWFVVVPDVVEDVLKPAVDKLSKHYHDETMVAVFLSDEGRRVKVTIEFDGGQEK